MSRDPSNLPCVVFQGTIRERDQRQFRVTMVRETRGLGVVVELFEGVDALGASRWVPVHDQQLREEALKTTLREVWSNLAIATSDASAEPRL